MSHTFTKLFSSITESTVWCEPHGTRLTWITMLAMADRHGRIFASIPGLANRARVTLQECEQAIQTFLAPDPYSRTPDHDGRRIEPIDGGWRLLNYAKYRDAKDAETVREQKRDYMRRVRGEEKASAECGNDISTMECGGNKQKQKQKQKQINQQQEQNPGARAAPLEIPDWLPADAWQDWHVYRNSRKGWTHKARCLSLRRLTELWGQGQDPRAVIEQSIERGWTGLFPVHRTQGDHDAHPRRRSAAEEVRAAVKGRAASGTGVVTGYG